MSRDDDDSHRGRQQRSVHAERENGAIGPADANPAHTGRDGADGDDDAEPLMPIEGGAGIAAAAAEQETGAGRHQRCQRAQREKGTGAFTGCGPTRSRALLRVRVTHGTATRRAARGPQPGAVRRSGNERGPDESVRETAPARSRKQILHHPSMDIGQPAPRLKKGFSDGETDEFGYNVVRDPVHVHDFQATLLYLLGIDHAEALFKHQGRRYRLTDVHGRVVKDLLA